MAEDDPKSALVIRAGGRTIHPSPDDIEQIREAVSVATEIFQSLIEVAIDDRTAAGLRAGGNGEAQGPIPVELQEIAQELSEALTAFSGEELDTDSLRQIATDLEQRANGARDLFEARSEQFTPRPVDQAEPIAVAGVLFAGLSDAAGALEQLLGLLEEVAKQSGAGHGGP
jgi:hypothetical protein